MHGDGGRSAGSAGVGVGSIGMHCVELWGCLAYSSNPIRLAWPKETITWRHTVMSLLNNHRFALITGIVLAIVVWLALSGFHVGAFNEAGLARWIHVVAGVFWIGLLYYFNVAQTPALADAAADKGGPGGAGITKYVAPRALFWFRWGAVATWLGGAARLGPRFVPAFTLAEGSRAIGTGAWLGTIMLFNVWVLIWPNQKKILGIVPADDAQKAKARKIAAMASRTNTMLSIPMLLCMASAFHGVPFVHG